MSDGGKELDDEERKSKEAFIREKEEEAHEMMKAAKEIFRSTEKVKSELQGDDDIDLGSIADLEDLRLGGLDSNGGNYGDKKGGNSTVLRSVQLKAPRLKQYSKGGNFSRFCERFVEYVHIAKIEDPDLFMLLLQNVDDETYSILKTVQLSTTQKRNATQFCDLYKTAIYGDEEVTLKTDLMRCRQKMGEDITSYAFRLREKANIAYTDNEIGEENCLLVFLQNVSDDEMRKKLNEASFQNFSEAIKQAKKIEAAATIGTSVQVASILKQTSFQEEREEREGRERGRSLDRGSAKESNSNSRDPRSQSNGSGRSVSQDRGGYNGTSNMGRSQGVDNYSRFERGGRSRNFDDRNIVCYNCNRRGHRKANCRTSWNNFGRTQNNRNYSNYGPNTRGGSRFGAPSGAYQNRNNYGYSRFNANNGTRGAFNNYRGYGNNRGGYNLN